MSAIADIETLMNAYQVWLKDRTVLRAVDGHWVEITTPYLDRHNDALQIYVRRENGGYLLSDDSYTIQDLEASGCNLDSAKRQELLRTTLAGFGVKMEDESLQVKASVENFPQRKHNLVQAMLAVNDLFYLASPFVAGLFFEDVIAWLDTHEIRYIPSVKFTGLTGYDHIFDFVIPKSKRGPERVLQAINRPTKESAMNFIGAWLDTRSVRTSEPQAYAVLNDSEQNVTGAVIDALRNHSIRPVLWSERASMVTELVA